MTVEKDVQDYFHDCFKVEVKKKTYQMVVYPFLEADLEPREGYDTYFPPCLSRRFGRLKKSMNGQEKEGRTLSTKSNTMECAICGVMDCNKSIAKDHQPREKTKEYW